MKTYSRKKPGESQEVILHLNELCRLCMAKEDVLVPIFNEDDAIPLTLRIMACVQLEVLEGDGLPNKICHPCKYQLEKSYSFRKKCEQSDMKLRHHVKMLQERLGDVHDIEDDGSEENVKREKQTMVAEEPTVHSSTEDEGELNTEQDLVGVTQVAYIDPTPDQTEENPENITLPVETDHLNREACTLVTHIETKKELSEIDTNEAEDYNDDNNGLYIISNPQEVPEEEMQTDVIEDQDLEAIAEAVKATLSSHPSLNINGELQIKVESTPGQPTKVHVTAEDGAVVIMELMTEDDVTNQDLPEQVLNEDGELRIFQCPDCPKSFARRIQLRRHASVHMQQRGYSCGICEKWFPTRSALIRHERIHTGERPFQCEVCQKSFAQKEILFRHLMTHTGQKPYNCPHCSKGFTQKEPLRVHLRTHLNPTPADIQLHYCTLCPKVFCHASGLSRHLITHTGKTFKCRDCDKSFTDKSSLRRHHRQTMHQE